MAFLSLLATSLAAFYMTGVIWLIQRVNYPLMAEVYDGDGHERFTRYEQAHIDRIAPVVAPAMIIEAFTAGMWLWFAEGELQRTLATLSFFGVVVVWGVTFFRSVPMHAQLQTRFDDVSHRVLVRTNWARTFAWTFRAVVCAAALVSLAPR